MELQKRRRARAPAILLTSDGHGHLTWTINFIPRSDDSQPGLPYNSINIYKSADGVTWPSRSYLDGWDLRSGNRDCSGGRGIFPHLHLRLGRQRCAALLERRVFGRLVIFMPLTLVKEDGTGKADANAYADVADGDAYHEGHLYATAWTGATAGQKAAALVMASRLIDAEYQFNGVRSVDSPGVAMAARQLSRPGQSAGAGAYQPAAVDPFVPAKHRAKGAVLAACEMARELLIADRTAAPAGEGLKYQNVGTNQTGYDKTDRRPIISPVAQACWINSVP